MAPAQIAHAADLAQLLQEWHMDACEDLGPYLTEGHWVAAATGIVEDLCRHMEAQEIMRRDE